MHAATCVMTQLLGRQHHIISLTRFSKNPSTVNEKLFEQCCDVYINITFHRFIIPATPVLPHRPGKLNEE
eukprot:gene72-49_t